MTRIKHLIVLMIFCSFVWVNVVIAQEITGEAKELPIAVVLSSSLETRPVPVSSAWLGYALSRLAWINDNVDQDDLETHTYTGSFDEEFTGRQSLAAVWGELKASDPLLKDKYLDELLLVQSNGYLKEYVWTYFGNDSWSAPSETLKFEEFSKWHAINLDGHTPETLAGLEIN